MKKKIVSEPEFLQTVTALKKNKSVAIDGLWGSSCALVTAALAAQHTAPVLMLLAKQEEIDRTEDDLELFSELPILPFSPMDDMETPLRVGDVMFGQRMNLLKELLRKPPVNTEPRPKKLTDILSRRKNVSLKSAEPENIADPKIIVTSIAALLQPVPSREILREKTQTLFVGESLNQEHLRQWLVDGGYHPTSGVELPCEFSVRGSLVDIFTPDAEFPVRIEFFGDEIESIRSFDVASQRSRETLKMFELTRLRQDETYQGHLTDYLPPETWVMLIEPQEIEKNGRLYLERLKNPEKLHKVRSVLAKLLTFPTVTASTLSEGVSEVTYPMSVTSVERFRGTLPEIREQLQTLTENEIHLVCQTEAEVLRLREAFDGMLPAKENRIHYPVGRLSGGFKLMRHQILVIGTSQLFQRTEIHRPRHRRLGQVLDSFTELKTGDYVVHVTHGIARYHGLELMTKGSQQEEHMKLEFADEVMLYVPISKIALVQKYVGGTRVRPKLAKVGGQLWNKQKRDAQEAIFDLAQEMIDLQASRDSQPGIPYPPDSDWQSEFDAAFPYRETDDQNIAVDAIKKDMMSRRPMDRLLCGDVGFGKTELAMRAAFKAVDAGYQTAVLVPTTILAEQHFRTFSARMSEFPVEIAVLSRFSTKKKQRQIIRNLADGTVDIVIGTHRLAQKDVAFHNLGLLIIDEEQRFGVLTKERLKQYRTTVDVLTLTATPIPRTLHLSLLGVRDISNLETPPEDRLAVETRLVRWDDTLIRTAILRELNRGGQTFFVHNKVEDIEEIAAKLRRIVPEAKIRVGHAQMHEHELEHIMFDFVNHQFDVLVATTIIESGLDIPNANTIFIDGANRYGLSSLHQLRGRVGRYKNQAYCYLLLDRNQSLTSLSAKRLRAIEEFSHLGAGFSIAMRDLEIRGAGNILGTQQSGHIALIGYEMYCQFLDSSIRMLRNLPQKTKYEVEIDLPGKALIPKSYVADHRMKIDLYRRLVRISSQEEFIDLRSEINDRFGTPPKTVEYLLIHAQIRVDARFWRIKTIKKEDDFIVFQCLVPELMEKLRKVSRKTIRLTDDRSAYLPLPEKEMDEEEILNFVKSVLRARE
ncbi:MAG: transcription-repair coupling factor [Planctomycetaceae bacterium]|nr:transcription-repair coupling factor [Planctomycetaceae bacterium]